MEKNNMILIPSGKYAIGTTKEQRTEFSHRFGCHPTWLNDDLPAQNIEMKSFWLDRHPITNAQYMAFTKATGHSGLGWWGSGLAKEYGNHPVVGVSGKDAEAYAKWAGKRLPTSEEWEAAICHPEGKVFPWGDEMQEELIAGRSDRPSWLLPETSPVGRGKRGKSVSGIEDFAGQASEWTANVMPHHGVQFRMLRGAGWFHRDPISYRSTFGWWAHEGWTAGFTGFRCALDADLNPPDVEEIMPTREEGKSQSNNAADGDISIQSGSGNSSHISILVPFLGSERISLSAPEGVSWDGQGLLNWYDKRDLKWENSTSDYASYMMNLKGIQIKAEFIVGEDLVDQVFTVMNHTGKPGVFRSSSCFNLQSHPLFYDFEGLRTYALTNGNRFIPIRNFERPGECVRWITGSVGKELEGLKRAMLAVVSQDGKWVIGCARADRDGRFSVSCNMCFTCLHPDSSYLVDKTRSSRLKMYFLKGGLDELLSRFDHDME